MSDKLKAAAANLISAADAFTVELDVAQKDGGRAPYALALALACDDTETVTVVSAGHDIELLKLACFMQVQFSGEVDPADASTVQ